MRGNNANQDVLNAPEASSYLRVNVQTIRRLARDGYIPAFKVGGQWRFKKSTLDEWAGSQHRRPRQRSILVVDDEEPVRDMVRRVLEKAGFKATTAPGGAEALEMMQREVPDAVVLDLKMPGMDGPTTLKEIRTRWQRMPVVILTAYPDSELMSRALQYPPITLLPKPATSVQIVETVNSVLASQVRGGSDGTGFAPGGSHGPGTSLGSAPGEATPPGDREGHASARLTVLRWDRPAGTAAGQGPGA